MTTHTHTPCKETTPLVVINGGYDDKNGTTKRCSNPKYDCVVDQDENIMTMHKNNTELVCDEFTQMLKLAIPVIGTYLLELLPGVISIILVGHIKSEMVKEYIDATTLAVMLFNIIGLSTAFGLATAMDTLCSQAYGAGESRKMGTYLQTGILVLSLVFVIICLAIYYTEDILIALGQPILVSKYAGMFSLILLPGLPFLYLFEMLKKILQAQNLPMAMLWSYVVANVVNVFIGYALVYHTSLGWLGAAVARTLSTISAILFLISYMLAYDLFKTFWCGLQIREALKGVVQFISLGIPGMLQLIFEWWAFEVLALISGLLPNPLVSIGANALLLQISSMVYMIYLGISISGNVRIGNALGAGLPKRAKLAAYLAISLGFITSLFLACFLLAFRTTLPSLFTHDEGIVSLTSKLLYISALFQIPDSINSVCNGVFRGTGRQIVGAQLNFCAYYIVGIPIGAYLAFQRHMGVMGLWFGMTIGLTTIAISGTLIIIKNDWTALTNEARDRTKMGDLSVISSPRMSEVL